MTLPFLPYYVQELGVTGLEQVAFWAGLLTTAQSMTMVLIAPLWGSLAGRYGRKIMVVRARFGGAVIICLMGFSRNVYQLTILRAIQGALTGTVSAATTLVASSTPPERRGFAIGIPCLWQAFSVGMPTVCDLPSADCRVIHCEVELPMAVLRQAKAAAPW